MILSYHPLFAADPNIVCAGRSPDAGDPAAAERCYQILNTEILQWLDRLGWSFGLKPTGGRGVPEKTPRAMP